MNNTPDDITLVNRFRQGDERAFNEIVHRYKKQIYYTIFRMVRNSDDAMDLAQDTFVRAYKAIAEFNCDSSLYTWLYRIAVNLSINYMNRNKTKDWQSLDDVVKPLRSPTANPGRAIEEKELNIALRKAIQQLPEKQRAIFVLRFYQDLSHKEIAAILDRSEGSVKANYFHAIQKLKEELSEFQTR